MRRFTSKGEYGFKKNADAPQRSTSAGKPGSLSPLITTTGKLRSEESPLIFSSNSNPVTFGICRSVITADTLSFNAAMAAGAFPTIRTSTSHNDSNASCNGSAQDS